ncbi:hypothetical protein ACTQ46_02870 [Gallicola sp. Sow4_E12]
MFFCLNNRATQKKSGVMEIFVGNFYQQGDDFIYRAAEKDRRALLTE